MKRGSCVVLSALKSRSKAETLARALVKEKLAACVSLIGPVTSFYQWEQKLVREKEIILLIKTSSLRFPQLKKWLASHHGYQVPEIISLPISDGNKLYIDWILKNTQK